MGIRASVETALKKGGDEGLPAASADNLYSLKDTWYIS
jgi:hypothetical protein